MRDSEVETWTTVGSGAGQRLRGLRGHESRLDLSTQGRRRGVGWDPTFEEVPSRRDPCTE